MVQWALENLESWEGFCLAVGDSTLGLRVLVLAQVLGSVREHAGSIRPPTCSRHCQAVADQRAVLDATGQGGTSPAAGYRSLRALCSCRYSRLFTV